MNYVWWRDFLDPSLLQMVRDTAIQKQDLFVPTTVTTNVADYRRSTVLWHYHYVVLYDQFTAKLRSMLPIVQNELNEHFDASAIEMQMTASGSDDYFKMHNDNGTPDTATRRLTYVYYFLLHEPKAFSGGDLLLHTSPEVRIPPHHNSIVWFPSGLSHEVCPVQSSGKFLESRLTCNGWIRTATLP